MSHSMHCNRGFSIVEVLVALVVLAIGLLGIAGLYVESLRSGGAAINRMQAINLAMDLADRIRANRTATVAYADVPSTAYKCIGAGAVACTPQELAADDLQQWNSEITSILPQGTGSVAVGGVAAPFSYQITIQWSEPGQSAPLAYVLRLQI